MPILVLKLTKKSASVTKELSGTVTNGTSKGNINAVCSEGGKTQKGWNFPHF